MQELISHVNNELQLTSSSAIGIEVLSSLQIIHLIFKTFANSEQGGQFLFYGLYKTIPFLTGAFEIAQDSTYQTFVKLVWILCLCYLLLLLLISIIIILFKSQKARFGNIFFKIFALICLVHTRLIFFPIQFFLLSLTPTSETETESTVFYQQTGFLVMTAFLISANALFAFAKEFIFYQITQNRNYYAVKTNIYHQITIVYKCFGLILYQMSLSYSALTKANAILHLIFAAVLLYVLYMKLPFYKFQILKIAIISSAFSFTLAATSIVQVFTTNTQVLQGLQIFLLFAPGVMIKFCFGRFKVLFQNILKGSSKSPEHSTHLVVLVKELILNPQKVSLLPDSLVPSIIYYTGVFERRCIKVSELIDPQKKQSIELKLYEDLAQKFEDLRLQHPESELIFISAAQIYLNKLNMPSKAMELIKKVESESSSIPIKSSIRSFYLKLEKVFSRSYLASETHVELQNYFKYNRIANSLKRDMLGEIDKHLNFWQDLLKSGIDVKKTIDNVQKIDHLWNKIQRLFQTNRDGFGAHFPKSLLMYSVYLNNIRQMPEEGIKVLKKYDMASLNAKVKDSFGLSSGILCAVIISIDKQKLGEVLDVSGSIQSVFEVNKKDLVGQNFACLFPTAIAKKYKHILQQYIRNSLHNFEHKDDVTYGKLPNGNLFELEAHFQLYPHMGKEMAVIILLKKLSGPKPLMIVNRDGYIIDCSKNLEKIFQKESINLQAFKTIQDMSFEFKDINRAFNLVYSNLLQTSSVFLALKNPDSNKGSALNGAERRLSILPSSILPTTIVQASQEHRNSVEDSRVFPKLSTSIGNFMKTNISTDLKGSLKEKASASEITIQEANKICETCMKGKKLTINRLPLTPMKKDTKVRISMQVSVQIIEEDVYKIIYITDLARDKFPLCYISNYLKEDETSESSLFADEFSLNEEKPIIENRQADKIDSKPQTPNSQEDSVLYGEEAEVQIINVNGSNPAKASSPFQDSQEKSVQPVKKAKEDDQRNSVMESNHKEARISKALRLVASRKKIHPLLKWSIVIVYAVILEIACLSWVNFSLSRKSIQEIERGIEVVNIATLRMQDILGIWQFSLILHENTVGVQSYPDYLLEVIREYMIQQYQTATIQNNELKNKLALINDKNFLLNTFVKDIKIWNSPGENYQLLDTFLANNVLVSQYMALNQVLGTVQTTYLDEVSLLFNNTANDYLITSFNLIDNTENLLQKIINKNEKNLKIVFTFEILSLATLFLAFLILLFVILHSYKKLFRALVRTQEKNILARLSNISKVKTLLEKDIETQTFQNEAFDMLENSKPKENPKKPGKNNSSSKSELFMMKGVNFFVLRNILLALIAMPIFAILFAVKFADSLATFSSFENENQKVSVLSQLSYQQDLFINSLLYTVIYQNTTDILFFNQKPEDQLISNLDLFNNVNEKLSTIFLAQDGNNIDPIIESILKDNVCPFLSETTQSDCQNATQGGELGLAAINAKILRASIDIAQSYVQNPTLDNAKILLINYNLEITTSLTTVKEVYPFLTNYVLEKFEQKVNEALQRETVFFASICGTIVAYALFVHVVCLTKLRTIDLGIRKILKIIPYQMIQENRTMSFYLIRNFGKEIEGIKSIL